MPAQSQLPAHCIKSSNGAIRFNPKADSSTACGSYHQGGSTWDCIVKAPPPPPSTFYVSQQSSGTVNDAQKLTEDECKAAAGTQTFSLIQFEQSYPNGCSKEQADDVYFSTHLRQLCLPRLRSIAS